MMLYGGSSAARREHYLRWYFAPIAGHALQDTRWASVTLAVAQYWDDEASDAVHTHLAISADRDPTWPTREARAEDADDDHWGDPDSPIMRDNAARSHALDEAKRALLGADFGPFYGDNYDLIVAFAAFCKTGSNQNMDYGEAYLPYAIARRGGAGVEIEVVGTVQQPGWEDRPLKPDRASRITQFAAMTPRAERARQGAPIDLETLLRAADGWSELGEATALGWRLAGLAERAGADPERGGGQKLLAEVEAWLEAKGVSTW